jgi:hypothetical protein
MSAYKTDIVKVKPYVAEFLKKQLGDDLRLVPNSVVYYLYIGLCSKKLKRFDVRINTAEKGFLKHHKMVDVQFTITQDFMYRYGYTLTDTCEVIFRNFLEEYAKIFIGAGYLATKEMDDTIKLKDQIDIIRQITNISEDGFSKDSMQKHFYRTYRKPVAQQNQLNLFQ